MASQSLLKNPGEPGRVGFILIDKLFRGGCKQFRGPPACPAAVRRVSTAQLVIGRIGMHRS